MKIINFKSGLGNQIFQYMFYEYLKQHTNEKIYGYYNKRWLRDHNGLELHNVFDVEIPKSNIYSNLISVLCRFIKKFKNDTSFCSTDTKANIKAIYFDGYWQNLKYYDSLSFKIKFRDPILSIQNAKILSLIESSNSVSIHIRRGDYLQQSTLVNCSLHYYKMAVKLIYKNFLNPTFFVFSDDIEWVKKNLQIKDCYFIDWNVGQLSYLDMFLMTYCKSHIIANSSFSYWGAMLVKHTNGINICPAKWYNNDEDYPSIIPINWIKINI